MIFRWKRGVGVLIITVHPNAIAGLFMRRAENQPTHTHRHTTVHTNRLTHVGTHTHTKVMGRWTQIEM